MKMEVFQKEAARLIAMRVKGNVSIREIVKNNGVKKTALIISEEACNVSPTIYLEAYLEKYHQYQSMEKVVEDILSVYEANKISKVVDVRYMMAYENCKNRIFTKLISRERNKTLLNEVPWTPYLDLAMVYYIECVSEDREVATVLIRNSMLEYIGCSKEDIEKTALENLLKRKRFFVADMYELLESGSSELQIEEYLQRDLMYVATNQERIYGAAAILRKDIMEEAADRLEGDVLIFPSSVHEIICMKYEKDTGLEEMRGMVQEINATELLPEEYLSDNVYIYKRETKEIILA